MRMVPHGGQCCGMRTMYGFGIFSQATFDEFFLMFDDFRNGRRDWTYVPPIPQYAMHNGDYIRHPQTQRALLEPVVPEPFQGTEVAPDRVARYSNRLIEVVLMDAQLVNRAAHVPVNGLRCSSWLQALTALGFRRVSRFRNSNSNHYCNVFHYVNVLENTFEEPVPAIRPTVVFTYYRKVYASGNVGLTMYPTTFEAFNGHRGRDPRINKYEVMSDASVRVTEGLRMEDEE